MQKEKPETELERDGNVGVKFGKLNDELFPEYRKFFYE